MRTPVRSSSLGELDRRHLDGRRVVRVDAADDPVEERVVAHVAGHRPDLVEARGEGDDAVARDGAVGRPQADVAAEGRRQLDRAAGVGAERPGREARRDRRGRAAAGAAGDARRDPTGSASGRRRSSRSRSPSRTRRCSSCRAAAGRPPCSARRRSRRRPGRSCSRIREPAVVRTPARRDDVLEARSARPSPSGSSTCGQEGVQLRVARRRSRRGRRRRARAARSRRARAARPASSAPSRSVSIVDAHRCRAPPG